MLTTTNHSSAQKVASTRVRADRRTLVGITTLVVVIVVRLPLAIIGQLSQEPALAVYNLNFSASIRFTEQ